MLKTLFLGLLLLFAFAFSHAQTYQSRVSQTICTEISLKKVGGKVTYSFKAIPNQKSIKTQVVNLTDIPFEGDVLTISGDKSVWFIPFGLDLPAFKVGGGAGQFECWGYKCHCDGNNQVCAITTTADGKTCGEAGSDECCVGFQYRINCGSKHSKDSKHEETAFVGAGIFVEADEVEQE